MTAATGLTVGFRSLATVRFLFGLGEAGTLPATARTYARWLPHAERGRAFGLAIMTGALGGALAGIVIAVSSYGWLCAIMALPVLYLGAKAWRLRATSK